MSKGVMSFFRYLLPTALLFGLASVLVISACGPSAPPPPPRPTAYQQSATASLGPQVVAPPAKPLKDPRDLLKEAKVYKDLIPRGTHARKYRRKMDPRFITIHSTQNFSQGADAWRHSLALKNGKLRAYKRRGGNRIGYLVWHYTVDESVVVQHLPTNEQGEHADFDGPGNNYSIGVEMCEHRGNDRTLTIERTAKLTAYLMHEHGIKLHNVVPHYHWPRKGLSKPNKNCPHFLLDNGKPGRKWQWFLAKVKEHYDDITVPVPLMPQGMPTNTAPEGGNYTSPAEQHHYLYGL